MDHIHFYIDQSTYKAFEAVSYELHISALIDDVTIHAELQLSAHLNDIIEGKFIHFERSCDYSYDRISIFDKSGLCIEIDDFDSIYRLNGKDLDLEENQEMDISSKAS
ncbi:hypothetical protein [Oceanisphaera arctica]|uniref:Uncharacterized protein n=1 Tax=Oceanisphaera arctica TaxID=641510 RepID=A0A2P5TK63_9GAMM|nr:hypothetical protein [Oceanisphaera arctica]PPL15480.1 hypothetical protein UN63_12445 [Oceanisphaera arctica]GHA05346.1 hypothetical protein GCM10007082_02790 [Oceanisphaera arctica]